MALEPKAAQTFPRLLALRSQVGNIVNWPVPGEFSDVQTKAAKRIYAGLSEDIYGAARQVDRNGGHAPVIDPVTRLPTPGPMESALKAQDNFVTAWNDSNKELNFGTFAAMAKSNVAVTAKQMIDAGQTDLGRTFTEMRAKFAPKQYDALLGASLMSLGRVEGPRALGEPAWNAAQFAANWERIQPFRQKMFTGTAYDAAASKIDDLYELGKNLSRFPTSTGAVGGRMFLAPLVGSMLAGGAARAFGAELPAVGIASTAGAFAVPYAAAKAMYSPLSVKTVQALLGDAGVLGWIGAATRATATTAGGALKVSPVLAMRFLILGKTRAALRPALQEYRGYLENQGVEFPDPATTQHLNGNVGTSYQPIH